MSKPATRPLPEVGRRMPVSMRMVLPDRPVAVCRELTKRFEEVVRELDTRSLARVLADRCRRRVRRALPG